MKRKAAAPLSKPKTKKVKSSVSSQGDYQRGREIARTPKQELKAFDTSATVHNVNTIAAPPAFDCLNATINGAELYQRVGRKIYMKSLHIRGVLSNILTSVQDVVRIIVYYDSQANAAAPLIGTLLQDSNAGAATSVYSEINLTNRQRFKILRDHQVAVPAVTFTAGVLTNLEYPPNADDAFNVNMFIKLKGLETVFNGVNGGTIADITSGAIGLTVIIGTTNASWAFTYTARLRFYD